MNAGTGEFYHHPMVVYIKNGPNLAKMIYRLPKPYTLSPLTLTCRFEVGG